MSTGYPGYDSYIGPENATIGRILKDHGCTTSWFGKNHNTPGLQYAGPYDQWPSGMGFEYSNGFLGGVDGIEQKPIEGVSMVYTFAQDNANALSTRTTQYFEMVCNRGCPTSGYLATGLRRAPFTPHCEIPSHP